jgi:hypothetical protein
VRLGQAARAHATVGVTTTTVKTELLEVNEHLFPKFLGLLSVTARAGGLGSGPAEPTASRSRGAIASNTPTAVVRCLYTDLSFLTCTAPGILTVIACRCCTKSAFSCCSAASATGSRTSARPSAVRSEDRRSAGRPQTEDPGRSARPGFLHQPGEHHNQRQHDEPYRPHRRWRRRLVPSPMSLSPFSTSPKPTSVTSTPCSSDRRARTSFSCRTPPRTPPLRA